MKRKYRAPGWFRKLWPFGGDEDKPEPTSASELIPEVSQAHQPKSDEPSYEQLMIEKSEWEQLHIPEAEVQNFRNALLKSGYAKRFTPKELHSITMKLNSVLKENGFAIEKTFLETLGLLNDELILKANNKPMDLSWIAVWKEAEARVRTKHNLGPEANFNMNQNEEFKGEFKALKTEAAARVEVARVEKTAASSTQSVGDDRPELGDLMKRQAIVMAKRNNKKLPDGDSQKFEGDDIPPEIMAAEIKQAKVDYRKMHGFPEDWESQYWQEL